MPIPDITTVLSDNPELVVLLAAVLRAVRAYQNQLTWREYRMVHRLKRGLFPVIHAFTKGALHLVNEKGGRDDAEFVSTVEASVRETATKLCQAGASLHLVCSIKRRPDEHGDPLTDAHVIWTVEGDQVEAYIFDNADGSCDVYAHTESSIDDPMAHLGDPQQDGDLYDVLPELVE